jgi:hypothetical protein
MLLLRTNFDSKKEMIEKIDNSTSETNSDTAFRVSEQEYEIDEDVSQ